MAALVMKGFVGVVEGVVVVVGGVVYCGGGFDVDGACCYAAKGDSCGSVALRVVVVVVVVDGFCSCVTVIGSVGMMEVRYYLTIQ
jgi:hypothetical protein